MTTDLALAAWHMYVVVIASASRTEDPGFESRQGVRSLYIAVLLSKLNKYIVPLYVFEKLT
jgi:hypothetical protein